MNNDSRKPAAGKSHQTRPGTSRAVPIGSSKGVERSALDAEKMGAGSDNPSRGDAGSALAHPVSGAGGIKARCFLWEAAAQAVRVVGTPEQPWFVAKDVCAVLEIQNVSQALEGLDSDEKGVCNTYTLGGPQDLLTVNESGLYALIFRSRKEQARLFRKWVTAEVLPAIRKTGQYQAPAPAQPQLAKHEIYIHQTFTPPVIAQGEEQLVFRLLAEVFHYTQNFSRSAVLVHGHTICDIARRENTFGPWFGPHRDFQGNARFMKNLSRFFNRPCVQPQADINDYGREITILSTYTIRPEGHNRYRRYIITSGQINVPGEILKREPTAEAVAIVQRAIGNGGEVVVK